MEFSAASCYFSRIGADILVDTLLLNAFSLCSSPNMRDQASHPYRTIGKCVLFNILTFMFIDRGWEDKILNWMVASIPWILFALNS